jgi:pyridoxal phosphate enzyme (YggS family)
VETAVAESVLPVAARLTAVRERIAGAARRAGRDPGAVTLVAVSKTFPPEHIRLAVAAGVADLGENRVQEAEAKIPQLPAELRWHLVGHLQSNKVRRAIELFSLIHGVDTVSLGQAIGKRAAHRARPADVLLQVNVAGKETQHGFAPEEVAGAADALAGVSGLALDGLMCIAPEADDPEAARPAFRLLARLYGDLAPRLQRAGHPWRHLSMGMSHDFPVAVEEGATLVRVGRAIFGERPAPAAI